MPETTLDQMVTEQITNAEEKVNNDIQDAHKKFADGEIVKSGPGCIVYFRNLRDRALEYFLPIKQEFYKAILNSLVYESNTHGLDRLREISKDINCKETQRRQAIQDRARISSELRNRSKYEKFMLYGDLNAKRKDNDSGYRDDSVRRAVLQAQKDYEAKSKSDTFLGIVVSLIFAMMDFNIIYNVFLSSNMSLNSALISAVLSAVMLDIPPYVLGNLLQRKNDRERLWVLRGKLLGKNAEIDLRPYEIGTRLLVGAIALFFLMYLALRVILFFGGGDFDLAWHFLLNWEFDFAVVEFNSSDFISTLFPIVTSAVAFVFGLTRYTSFTGHIEKTVVIIDKELRVQMGNCSSAILRCEEQQENLRLQLDETKRVIWTFYFKQAPLPKSDGEFKQKVAAEFQRRSLELYPEIYRIRCIQLRESAERALKNINTSLAPDVANPQEINSMELSTDERTALDSLWVTKAGAAQHEGTKGHIKMIEKKIQELVRSDTGSK